MADDTIMYDDVEETKTRFIGFFGETKRFDLAITQTDHFYGKSLVVDIQNGQAAIIGPDDLEEEGYLEHAFQLNEEEAQELNDFLSQLIV
jgi:hypothetical protein